MGECRYREEFRKRNDKEVVEKTQTKKDSRLFASTVDEMEKCDPTTSFGEVYGKHLELEEVCVETERSREQRENTQYLITMLEGLITKATTPQEKRAYETDLVDHMWLTVEKAKLKALVSSSTSDTSMSSPSSQSVPSTNSDT